jgi:ArsR family transcriptional regulator
VTSATTDRPGAGAAHAAAPALDPSLLRLLADPLRARIITLLSGEQLCTCHLVELTGARQTNISNHLRALREAGVVTAVPYGRFTYYRLETEPLRSLAAALGRLVDAAEDTPGRRHPCS